MRLLALALLLLAAPVQDEKPGFKRALTLRHNGYDELPAGVQVAISLPARSGAAVDPSEVRVYHKGRPLPVWSKGRLVWFKLAASIGEFGKDADYEVRYGGEAVKAEPEKVFEFFAEPSGSALDPDRWEVDPRLAVQEKEGSVAVVGISKAVSEHDPASIVLKNPRPREPFVVDIDLRWDLDPEAALEFATRLEIAHSIDVPEETRARCAELLKRLAGDEIQGRQEASRALIKLGKPAVPQLEAFIRSQEGENQAAASAILNRIQQEFPPPMVRGGFLVEQGMGPGIKQTNRLGNSRSELANALTRKDSGFFSVERSESGSTVLQWLGGRLEGSKIEGAAGRIRFDFWGGPVKNLGAVWIARVLIRRPVEFRPEAVFGREETVK